MKLLDFIGIVSGILGIVSFFVLENDKKRKALLLFLVLAATFFAGALILPKKVNPKIITVKEKLSIKEIDEIIDKVPNINISNKPTLFVPSESSCEDEGRSIEKKYQRLFDGYFYGEFDEYQEGEFDDEEEFGRKIVPIGKFKIDESLLGLVVCLYEYHGCNDVNDIVLFIWNKNSSKAIERLVLAQFIWANDAEGGGELKSLIFTSDRNNELNIIQEEEEKWTKFFFESDTLPLAYTHSVQGKIFIADNEDFKDVGTLNFGEGEGIPDIKILKSKFGMK